jgi:hypothetical protein
MQFTTCAFVTSPLGYLWLGSLEACFPGRPLETGKSEELKGSKPPLSVTNTVAKIVIDQTIGGAWNTVLFILTMGMLKGLDYDSIIEQIHTVCQCHVRRDFARRNCRSKNSSDRHRLRTSADADVIGLLAHYDRGCQTVATSFDFEFHNCAYRSAVIGR